MLGGQSDTGMDLDPGFTQAGLETGAIGSRRQPGAGITLEPGAVGIGQITGGSEASLDLGLHGLFWHWADPGTWVHGCWPGAGATGV